MFVTLEGPEGAGKSTLIASLTDILRSRGKTVVATREPGGGPLGPAIRSLLLDSESVPQAAELFLFLADRADHVASVIRPALEQGDIVLCDRFCDSTIVYQGHARGFPLEEVRRLCDLSSGGLRPDLTLLLDLPVSEGLARITSKDRLDSEPVEFHERVRQGFLTEAGREPNRWRILDATLPASRVLEDALAALGR